MNIVDFREKYKFVHDAIAAAFSDANIADCTFDFGTEYMVCFKIGEFERCYLCEYVSDEYEVLKLDEARLRELIDKTKRTMERITR